jgi:Cys-tRNA(Pro)/Cys-tRNA(Cys) deacylase
MHKRIADTLAQAGVSFTERRHADCVQPIRSPADFAEAIGYSLERVTKTLFLRDTENENFCLVTLSSNKRLDFDKLASLVGAKRLQLSSKDDLALRLGYPPTGVSPIGSKGTKVIMDGSLLEFDSILVGGGEVAVEVELAPADLKAITNATAEKVSL